MPKVWEERAKAIEKSEHHKGIKEEKARSIAYATATKQLQKKGILKKGTRKLK